MLCQQVDLHIVISGVSRRAILDWAAIEGREIVAIDKNMGSKHA